MTQFVNCVLAYNLLQKMSCHMISVRAEGNSTCCSPHTKQKIFPYALTHSLLVVHTHLFIIITHPLIQPHSTRKWFSQEVGLLGSGSVRKFVCQEVVQLGTWSARKWFSQEIGLLGSGSARKLVYQEVVQLGNGQQLNMVWPRQPTGLSPATALSGSHITFYIVNAEKQIKIMQYVGAFLCLGLMMMENLLVAEEVI